jgi:pimeloyl-ACP methyl ester carboxylesterase
MVIAALLAVAMLSPTTMARPTFDVVLIHGAGGGAWEYDKWKPILSHHWLVRAKDLQPAAGGLAKTTLGDYVDQVTAPELSFGGRAKLVLVGASMGGILALRAAETMKPDAIVLINSVPPAAIDRPKTSRIIPDVVRWANGPLKDTREAMPDSDEKTIQWAHKRWRDESGAVMRELANGVKVEKPKCPVLIILSDKDTDVPHKYGLELAKLWGADVKVFEGMSHVGPLLSTRAEEVAKYVVQWMDRKTGRTLAK